MLSTELSEVLKNDITINITINAEAVKAFFELFAGMVSAKEEKKEETREESNKEENKEDIREENTNTPLPNNTPTPTQSINPTSNNNINNNICGSGVIDYKAIPTCNDVEEYCKEKGYIMDAKKFYEYYKALGWNNTRGRFMAHRWKDYVDHWMNTGGTSGVSGINNVQKPAVNTARPFVPTEF